MQRRSTTILLIGVLTLVLGAATTFVALRSPKRAAAAPRVRATLTAPGSADDVTIPPGKQAIALALDPVAGTAGVARAGSHIDVFAAVSEKGTKPGDTSSVNAARLILQNVSVLRVDQGGVSSVTTKDTTHAAGSGTVFVLAVNANEAEKLVFHASFSKLWFSVVPADQKPVGTPGVDSTNQLQPEAA